MAMDREALRELLAGDVLDFFIRLGLIVLAVVACERIFAPFIPIMSWGLILAVSFYPLHLTLMARLGTSPGRAATLLVLAILLLLGVEASHHLKDVRRKGCSQEHGRYAD
ncbi:MAG: hypothetical protein AAGL66_05280, partial [Pseudomonadota bacterium]